MGSGGCCEHCASTDSRLDSIEKSLVELKTSFEIVKGLVFGATGLILTVCAGWAIKFIGF